MNNVMVNKMTTSAMYGPGPTSTLDVYGGTIPTVGASSSFTASTYASQLLARFTVSSYASNPSTGICKLPAVNPVNATATGTVTWFAWYTAGTCIIGSVSDVGPNIAPMYINSINLVAGSQSNVIQVGFKLSFN